MDKREIVINKARQMLGVNYGYQQRSEWQVDCLGLLYVCFKEAGIVVDYPTDYGSVKDTVIMDTADALFDRIPFESAKPGDFLLFRNLGQVPNHLSIIVEDGFMIHAIDRSSRGLHKVQIDPIDGYWIRMMETAYNIDSFRG